MPESFERTELRRWFKKIWRNTEGAVKLAFQVEKDLFWQNVMFAWPSQEEAVVEWVLAKVGQGADVFYAPAIFKDRTSGKSANVLGSWVLWVEIDGTAPEIWEGVPYDKHPAPSVRLQSSVPGRQHCYWLLDEFVGKEVIESKNRALAYELDADTSGWDAGQVLRPPSTKNYGHAKIGRRSGTYDVELLVETETKYGPSFIEVPPHFVEIVKNSIDLTTLPSLALVLAKGKWTDEFYKTFFADKSPEKGDRSTALMEIGYFGAEAGLSDPEIYVLVETADSRWGKYTNRTPDRRFSILADIVERARFKHPKGSVFDFVANFGRPSAVEPKIVYTNREFRELKVEFQWSLENLLTVGGLGMIAGEPGVGKTQLSNQIGMCLASGMNFLNWKNSTGPSKTLLLQLEMPLAGTQKFLSLQQSNLLSSQMEMLDENLLISPLGSALPLDTESGRKFLIDLVQKYQPRFLVIDSLAKSTTKSLNEDVPARQLNDWLQAFRKQFGVSVIVVHHSRKGMAGNKKAADLNPMDELFGSRYITGDLDFFLACYKLPKRKGYLYVREAKNRYAAENPDLTIYRQPDLTFKVDKVHSDEEDTDNAESLIASFLNGKFDRG